MTDDGYVAHADEEWDMLHTIIEDTHPDFKDSGADKPSLRRVPGAEKRHERCRAAGAPFCQNSMVDALRARISSTMASMCKCENENEAKQRQKKLLDGFLIFCFRGRQPVAVDLDHDGDDEELPEVVHYLHASFVWGGLKQFYPVFAELHLQDSDADSESMQQHASHWAPPEVLELQLEFTQEFCDYHELVLDMDTRLLWELQFFELAADYTLNIGTFVPGCVSAIRAHWCEPTTVWRGARVERLDAKIPKGSHIQPKARPRRQPAESAETLAASEANRPTQTEPMHSTPFVDFESGNFDLNSALDELEFGIVAPVQATLPQAHSDEHNGNDDAFDDECGNGPEDFGDAASSSGYSASIGDDRVESLDHVLDPSENALVEGLLHLQSQEDALEETKEEVPEGQGPETDAAGTLASGPEATAPVTDGDTLAEGLVVPVAASVPVPPADVDERAPLPPPPHSPDHDGSGAAAAAAPVEAAGRALPAEIARPEGPRLRHDALYVRGPDGAIVGEIKVKPTSNDMFVRCYKHRQCFKTKTLNASERKLSQGRPAGFLAAWVLEADDWASASEHNRFCVPSMAKRSAARRALEQEPNFQDFGSKERPLRPGEGPEPDE